MIVISIVKDLNTYYSLFPSESNELKPLLFHVEKNINSLYDRKNFPGHITASGFILKDNHLLCIFHPFIKKWFQPGGHIEEGEKPLEASFREVLEETGLHVTLHPWHGSKNVPFDIDIHYIPANDKKNEPGHYHYDFRYLFQVDTSKDSLLSELDSKWIPFEQLDDDLIKTVNKMTVQGIYNQ